MAPELQDHLFDLVAKFRDEGGVLGIYYPRHREILPDHDSLSVTTVVERSVLIDITTPAADHIAIKIHNHVQGAVNPFGIPAMETVKRHPVSPSDINPLPIDIEAELAITVLIDHLTPVQPHRPEADFSGIRRQNIPVFIDQGERSVIQGGLSITLRPPQVGFIQSELCPPGVRGK